MFEISIFCVIVLAIGYWTALWLMGRHDDVLHGNFVEVEPGSDTVPATSPAPRIDSADSLQSLLNSIKRDLKDAAQI
jgi:hypothetical protein